MKLWRRAGAITVYLQSTNRTNTQKNILNGYDRKNGFTTQRNKEKGEAIRTIFTLAKADRLHFTSFLIYYEILQLFYWAQICNLVHMSHRRLQSAP
jgi:hypothetical protein